MNQILGITLKKLRSGRFSAFAVLVGLGLLFTAASAKAGCGIPFKAAAAPPIPFVSVHADDDWHEQGSIVGLWHVIYTGTYDNNFPPGGPYPPIPFQFLESFKTWHADGNEFENAFLPPTGGNICFGVWKDLGDHRVKLHHIGLMFAPDGSISSIFTVDETDTVEPGGKTYKGVFDFKLWPPSYDAVGVGTPISEVKGTTAATRISID
ncbi:MAG: hypothetical protein WBR26_09865 [Candidatus Acidiferrum sp.]